MPGFNIDSYRANFKSGARQYLFYFRPLFPAAITADTETSTYLVRSTTIPESTTEEIITNWQGFDFKQSGKYTYTDWTVTFNVDNEAKIYGYYMNYMNYIHDPTTNISRVHAEYFKDQQLDLLDLNGDIVMKVKLVGSWVKNVSSATLDYSSNDILQFDVTYSYLYHTVDKTVYGNNVTYAS